MDWKPNTDFEKELVNAQPDKNFIFGSMLPAKKSKNYEIEDPFVEKKPPLTLYEKQTQRLAVITATQKIAKQKPLGERSRLDDWSNENNIEEEIKALVYHNKEEERKIASETLSSDPKSSVRGKSKRENQNQRGRGSGIIFDEEYFKFRVPVSSKTQADSEKFKPTAVVNSPVALAEQLENGNRKVCKTDVTEHGHSYKNGCNSTPNKHNNLSKITPDLPNEVENDASSLIRNIDNNNKNGLIKIKESTKFYKPKEIYEKKKNK